MFPGHAVDAGRRRDCRAKCAKPRARPSVIPPRAAAACSPSATTRSASRRRCSVARRINPQGLTGTLSHRCAGARASRTRLGAHQGRRADSARALDNTAATAAHALDTHVTRSDGMDRRQTGTLAENSAGRISRVAGIHHRGAQFPATRRRDSTSSRAPAICWWSPKCARAPANDSAAPRPASVAASSDASPRPPRCFCSAARNCDAAACAST